MNCPRCIGGYVALEHDLREDSWCCVNCGWRSDTAVPHAILKSLGVEHKRRREPSSGGVRLA